MISLGDMSNFPYNFHNSYPANFPEQEHSEAVLDEATRREIISRATMEHLLSYPASTQAERQFVPNLTHELLLAASLRQQHNLLHQQQHTVHPLFTQRSLALAGGYLGGPSDTHGLLNSQAGPTDSSLLLERYQLMAQSQVSPEASIYDPRLLDHRRLIQQARAGITLDPRLLLLEQRRGASSAGPVSGDAMSSLFAPSFNEALFPLRNSHQEESRLLFARSDPALSIARHMPEVNRHQMASAAVAASALDEHSDFKYDGKELAEKNQETQRRKSFPEKLMELLNMPEVQHIICWLPHGKSFIIVRPKVFASEIMPHYFRQAKYASFTRKLNRWGFRQVTKGPEHGAFQHKLFQRSKPMMCLKMFCGGTAYPKSASKRRATTDKKEKDQATQDQATEDQATEDKSNGESDDEESQETSLAGKDKSEDVKVDSCFESKEKNFHSPESERKDIKKSSNLTKSDSSPSPPSSSKTHIPDPQRKTLFGRGA